MEKVLLRNIAVEDSHKLTVYQSRRGYKALEKALKEMTPDQVTEEVSASGLRGRGGSRLSHRKEMELCAQGQFKAQVSHR